ncbi:hypothetical protein [Phragmitibacter flavus]|uniref:hypothetical protein n=1 Tax=Phragmitibacter flavus TaxID=2576071 RepID=UPI00140A97A5|nr:hypothetical protein [Phragmitibacter flavus]
MMSFLKHPIYTALAAGLGVWLVSSNMRGSSLWHTAGPPAWISAARSTFSHK